MSKSICDDEFPWCTPNRRLSPEVRKVWREIARKAPHLRKPDQLMVEILAVLVHQFRTEPNMQTARIGLMMKTMADLWMTPATRVNIPLPPEPSEYDWL